MSDQPVRTDATAPKPLGRLLVVDDEPAILDTVGRFLRFIGYEVRAATTAKDALIAARASSFPNSSCWT